MKKNVPLLPSMKVLVRAVHEAYQPQEVPEVVQMLLSLK